MWFQTYDQLCLFAVSDPKDVASGNTTVKDLYANMGYKCLLLAENKYVVGVPSFESGKVGTLPSLLSPLSSPLPTLPTLLSLPYSPRSPLPSLLSPLSSPFPALYRLFQLTLSFHTLFLSLTSMCGSD